MLLLNEVEVIIDLVRIQKRRQTVTDVEFVHCISDIDIVTMKMMPIKTRTFELLFSTIK